MAHGAEFSCMKCRQTAQSISAYTTLLAYSRFLNFLRIQEFIAPIGAFSHPGT